MSTVWWMVTANDGQYLSARTVEAVKAGALFTSPAHVRNPPVTQVHSNPKGKQGRTYPHAGDSLLPKAPNHPRQEQPYYDVGKKLIVLDRPVELAVPRS
jgi:hypothetical protein